MKVSWHGAKAIDSSSNLNVIWLLHYSHWSVGIWAHGLLPFPLNCNHYCSIDIIVIVCIPWHRAKAIDLSLNLNLIWWSIAHVDLLQSEHIIHPIPLLYWWYASPISHYIKSTVHLLARNESNRSESKSECNLIGPLLTSICCFLIRLFTRKESSTCSVQTPHHAMHAGFLPNSVHCHQCCNYLPLEPTFWQATQVISCA